MYLKDVWRYLMRRKSRKFVCIRCGKKYDYQQMIQMSRGNFDKSGVIYRRVVKCECGMEWSFFHGLKSDYWNEVEWRDKNGKWMMHINGCLTVFDEERV